MRSREPAPDLMADCDGTPEQDRTGNLRVADAMLRGPKTWSRDATAGDVRNEFADDHLHSVLIVENGRLIAVVERADLGTVSEGTPAWPLGRLDGRVVAPDRRLEPTRLAMVADQRRRLAVIDDQRRLLGLLCLKQTGNGFCADSDVAARAAERSVAPRSVTSPDG